MTTAKSGPVPGGPASGCNAGIVTAACATLLAIQAAILHAMGQAAVCPCGTVKLWTSLTGGPENSQQLTDWYTFTHLIHGFAFYLLAKLVAPGMPLAGRLVLVVAIEAGWEVFENTSFIIDRYRQTTIAQGYFGDSILNSLGDTLAAISGFFLAAALPLRASLAIVIAIEILLGWSIGDNLTLNIINLINPGAIGSP